VVCPRIPRPHNRFCNVNGTYAGERVQNKEAAPVRARRRRATGRTTDRLAAMLR